MEATKNTYCVKGEGIVELSTLTRWFKKFHSCWKNLKHQAKSGKPKSVASKAVHQAIDANPVYSSQRVPGELSIRKIIHNCWIISHITKIFQNFWLNLVVIKLSSVRWEIEVW